MPRAELRGTNRDVAQMTSRPITGLGQDPSRLVPLVAAQVESPRSISVAGGWGERLHDFETNVDMVGDTNSEAQEALLAHRAQEKRRISR